VGIIKPVVFILHRCRIFHASGKEKNKNSRWNNKNTELMAPNQSAEGDQGKE